jgi:RHS repeat-associated protein
VWGNDLSGSQQGAGGVGGLLEVSYYGSGTTNCFAAYDGNGNAAALINAADGTTLANYEYGPFGEVIRSTGTMAKNNPFRFSTKYQDDESDLLYYGYRYNKPSTGTWPNRDPLGEEGGVNLYGFIGNNPVNQFDELGLMKWADVVAKQKEVEAQVSKIKCCCNKPGPTRAFETIAGMASGETVTETATVDTHGCVLTIWSYFWWNCFRAQREAWWIFPGGPGWPDGWKEYGWEEGGPTDTESHAGKVPGGKRNSNQWNWNAAIIFTVCGADGHVHAFLVPSNESMWNWDPGTKSWTQ